MSKTDLKKELKELYSPSAREVSLVEVPDMNFVMVDGAGDPNTVPEFQQAIEALYGVSYTLKFTIKKAGLGPDYTVAPLEGLWWAADISSFELGEKDKWIWTLMIAQPDFVTTDMVDQAVRALRDRKDPLALSKLRFEPLREGLCVQIMHIGPYAEERPTLEKLHTFMQSNGYEFNGKHHEVYLSDPRRTAPEKMRTVIRQPVRRK